MTIQDNNSANQSKTQSWGDSINGVFKVTNFIHRYRLFSPFLYIPTSILNSIGSILAPIVLKSSKFKNQIMNSIDSLFGSNLSPKKKDELFETNRRYLIQMYLDALLHSPNIYAHTVNKFITFKNIHHLDNVLALGKGAIITTIHSSMFFHLMAGLVYHPKKYSLLTVVQPKNMMMYRSIITRPELRHFRVIPSLDYQKVKKSMEKQLKNNGIILIMFDYSKPNHFRVPAHNTKAPFLITTPQSSIRLHEVHNTPIIPVLIKPDGEIGKSIINFNFPLKISDIVAKKTGLDTKTIHGEFSIHLNKIFTTYLFKYAGFWEELRKLNLRRKITFKLTNSAGLEQFYFEIKNFAFKILENSYEPGRDDVLIKKVINDGFRALRENKFKEVKEILPFEKDIIDNSGTEEIIQLLKIAIEKVKNEPEVEQLKKIQIELKNIRLN